MRKSTSPFKFKMFKPNRHLVKGLASVEFIMIVGAIYTPLVLGTIEVAEGFYEYNQTARNVSAAARYLSVYSSTDATNYANRVTEAKNLVVCGTTTSCNTTLVSGLTTSKVSVATSFVTSGNIGMHLVKVRVSGFTYSYTLSFLPSKTWDMSASMQQVHESTGTGTGTGGGGTGGGGDEDDEDEGDGGD